MMKNHLMNNYGRLPIQFERGNGAWLWDDEGNRYLDAIGGIAVCALGHAHPAVAEAVSEQMNTLVHTSNLYQIGHQTELANKLSALSGMDNMFFSNSGAEANEAAIKLARLYGHKRNIDEPCIIVTDNSFHGRTLATLSATGNPKVQQGFEPLVSGFVRVPYNDIDAIKAAAEHNPNIVAVLVEPVQGEGGVNIPDADYLPQIRKLCDDKQWLMMLDEIQTGIGRTGKWFGFQHYDITPDVMTLAKALGNGVPIGACLARGEAAELFAPGSHGSTYGGNPLACRAALAVLQTFEQNSLIEKSTRDGLHILSELNERLANKSYVKNIRGQGLIIGIELDRDCAAIVPIALKHGLLVNVTASSVIRLLPPVIMDDKQTSLLLDRLTMSIENFMQEQEANV